MFNRNAVIWMLLIAMSLAFAVSADAKFITMSGRSAMGYFQSDKGGVYDTATFRGSDVKLVTTFELPADLKATFRMNINEGEFGSVDYAFLDVPLGFVGLADVKARVGQFKIPLGVETFIDNSIEQNLVNNSVGLFNGNDRGIMFFGKADVSDYGITYDLAFTEGSAHNSARALSAAAASTGDDPDVDSEKSITFRLGSKLTDALSVWGSWHNSGDLGMNGTSSAAVGGVTLTGAGKNAERELWLLHADYKFEQGLVKGYYGEFDDDTEAADGNKGKREGKVWMLEGRYDVTEKVYLGLQWSKIDLKGSNFLAPSGGTGGMGVNVNEMKRVEAGIAYQLGEWVTFKYAFTNNKRTFTSGSGLTDPDDDIQSLLVAVKF